jgi:cytochrome c553
MWWWAEGLDMLRILLTAIILAAAASPVLAASSDTPVDLKSVTVDLPFGNRTFPAGPGSDAINGSCLACHSAGMVLNQPALSRSAWTAEVNKMINAYKAPVPQAEIGPIIDYLVSIKGAP